MPIFSRSLFQKKSFIIIVSGIITLLLHIHLILIVQSRALANWIPSRMYFFTTIVSNTFGILTRILARSPSITIPHIPFPFSFLEVVFIIVLDPRESIKLQKCVLNATSNKRVDILFIYGRISKVRGFIHIP